MTDTINSDDLGWIAIGAKLDRIADATERQSVALERIASTLAAVTGRSYSECTRITGPYKLSDVSFIRTGDGRAGFGCDESVEDDDDE